MPLPPADMPEWLRFQFRTEHLVHLLRHLGAALVIVALTVLVYHVAARGLGLVERRRRVPQAIAALGRRVLRGLAVVMGTLLVLQSFGVLDNAWAAITAMFGLVAVGFFAVWSVLSNMLCSIILILTRPFDIGDTVEIPAEKLRGKAVNFSFLFTTLRDDDGGLIHVPNNLFFQKPIKRIVGTAQVTLDEQLMKETNTE